MSGMVPNYPGLTVTTSAPAGTGSTGSAQLDTIKGEDLIGQMNADKFMGAIEGIVRAAVREEVQKCMEDDMAEDKAEDENESMFAGIDPYADLVPAGSQLYVQQKGSLN